MKYLVITLLAVFMAFASLGCDEPATETTDENAVAEDSIEVVEEVNVEVTETVETVEGEITEAVETVEGEVVEAVEGEVVEAVEAVEGEVVEAVEGATN